MGGEVLGWPGERADHAGTRRSPPLSHCRVAGKPGEEYEKVSDEIVEKGKSSCRTACSKDSSNNGASARTVTVEEEKYSKVAHWPGEQGQRVSHWIY